MSCYYIYEVTNKSTGMTYVGQTANVMKRWRDHSELTPLQTAIAKEGIANFEFKVLGTCSSKEEATERELSLIHERAEAGPTYNRYGALKVSGAKLGNVYRTDSGFILKYRRDGRWLNKRCPGGPTSFEEASAWLTRWYEAHVAPHEATPE